MRLSVENELEKLRRELKAEQKRGFDTQSGLLNLIRSSQEQLTLTETLTLWQKGSSRHPFFGEEVNIYTTQYILLKSAGLFTVDEAKVGFGEVC